MCYSLLHFIVPLITQRLMSVLYSYVVQHISCPRGTAASCLPKICESGKNEDIVLHSNKSLKH